MAAFVACYLLLTQVVFQARYNNGIKDHERIYRIENTYFASKDRAWSSSVWRFMAEDLAAMPQVEGVTMIDYAWSPDILKFKQGNKEVDFPMLNGNNTALSNLTDQVVDGSIEWSENDRDGIIIPASIAKQYFGTTKAAGKTMLRFSNDSIIPLTVRGVYKDFPENSTSKNFIMVNVKDLYANTKGNMCFTCLVKFKPGIDDVNNLIEPLKQRYIATLQRMFNGKNDEELNYWKESINTTNFQFTPLDDIYYSNTDPSDKGDKHALSIIELIVLLIIVIATVNTMNYTLTMSPMWVRDTNTRLVIGATRSSIRLRYLAETVIVSLVACLLALVACQVIATIPILNNLFDGNIGLNDNPGIVIALLAIALAIGVISSLYPAYFVTSFKMATALKSNFGLTPKGTKLRTLLIGLQLIITMFHVSFICILYHQTQFIYNSEYGFDIHQILTVSLDPRNTDYRDELRQDLKRLPDVENVAYSRFILGSDDIYFSATAYLPSDTTKEFKYDLFPVDSEYFSTMGIEIVEGRGFIPTDEPENCFVINETMNKLRDSGNLILDKESNINPNIVGVCKNIRYTTTRANKNKPIAFIYLPSNYPCWQANVRITKDAYRDALKATIAQIIEKHIGHKSSQVVDMETILNDSYSNEFRFIKLVSIFSVICVIITLVGVFCLTMLETRYRRKEISIRKVAGATSSDIIRMLSIRYCYLILACFVIAAPIAYYIGNLWLDGFVEHQSIRWWVLPLTLLVVGGLTLGTILLQCWHIAHENPTNSLKEE